MTEDDSLYVNSEDLQTMFPPSPPPVVPRSQTRVNVVRPQVAPAGVNKPHPWDPADVYKKQQVEHHDQSQLPVVYIILPQAPQAGTCVSSQAPVILQAQYPATAGFAVAAQPPPVSLNPQPVAQTKGLSHAHSTLSIQSAPDLCGTASEQPEKKKKKKKALARFISFLRNLKKGKEAFDKMLEHPLAQQLGVPELVDDAKQLAIDGLRSQIGI